MKRMISSIPEIVEEYKQMSFKYDEASKQLKVLEENTQEEITQEENTMTINGKRVPFIAERLGVRVGEKFKIAEMSRSREKGIDPIFMICDDGTYTTIPENVRNSSLAILKAIDDPEHQVIKLLNISNEDKEALKALWTIWGETDATITILGDGHIKINSLMYSFHEDFYCAPHFYSIPKNKEFNLWDLILEGIENA